MELGHMPPQEATTRADRNRKEIRRLKIYIANKIISGRLRATEKNALTIRKEIKKLCGAFAVNLTEFERGILFMEIVDEIFGFGPFGEILREPEPITVIVVKPTEVMQIVKDDLEPLDVQFDDDAHLKKMVRRLAIYSSPEPEANHFHMTTNHDSRTTTFNFNLLWSPGGSFPLAYYGRTKGTQIVIPSRYLLK